MPLVTRIPAPLFLHAFRYRNGQVRRRRAIAPSRHLIALRFREMEWRTAKREREIVKEGSRARRPLRGMPRLASAPARAQFDVRAAPR